LLKSLQTVTRKTQGSGQVRQITSLLSPEVVFGKRHVCPRCGALTVRSWTCRRRAPVCFTAGRPQPVGHQQSVV